MSDKYKTLTVYRGRPCLRGHDGLRYKVSRNCVTCTIERARAVRQALTLARRRARAEEVDVDCTA
jgi:hypothetical protein